MNTSRSLTRTNGMAVSTIIVAASLLITLALPVATLTGPVGVYVLCALPTIIMMDGLWTSRQDGWLSRQHRLLKGVVMLLVSLAGGALVMFVGNLTIGGNQGPAMPEMSFFNIIAVVIAFWLVNMWQGWPFVRIRSRVGATTAVFVATYLIAAAVYYAFFDFANLPSVGAATPHGLFEAWHSLAYLVCFLTGMFIPPAFGFLGLGKVKPGLRQGLAWTGVSLVWGTIVYVIGLMITGDPVFTLVWVPVPLLFGGLIVLVMFRDSIFGHISALPLRGILTTALSYAVGVALVWLYAHQASVTFPDLMSGPPPYVKEVWIADATLSFTFPLLAVYGNLFGMWPFRMPPPPDAPAEVTR